MQTLFQQPHVTGFNNNSRFTSPPKFPSIRMTHQIIYILLILTVFSMEIWAEEIPAYEYELAMGIYSWLFLRSFSVLFLA